MLAIELNGLHVGKQLKVEFKIANADGTYRANAKSHVAYVVASRIEHLPNGNVMFSSTLMSEPGWKNSSGFWVNYSKVAGVPDFYRARIPYYAEVEVLND